MKCELKFAADDNFSKFVAALRNQIWLDICHAGRLFTWNDEPYFSPKNPERYEIRPLLQSCFNYKICLWNSNPFPANHIFCRLLFHLLIFLGSLYCKQYGPRSDSEVCSGLIVFASMIKSSLKCTLIYTSGADVESREIFRTKYIGGS